MNQLLDPLLTLILVHGYPIIFGVVLIGYFGLPIPLNAILIAAGSLTVNGTLSFLNLVVLVSGTAIACDIVTYIIARKYGYEVIKKTFLRRGITNKRLHSLNSFLEKWGWISLFISRWLITPLGVPMDILAGLSSYSFKKFLLAVVLGEIIWAVLYIYIGNLFGTNWTLILVYINNVPTALSLILLGIIFSYLGIKMWKRTHKK